jgi:hypothetical protein
LLEIASALSGRGYSFCVMTEHFEDLDATTFEAYVREANAVTESTGFILIPGVEVEVSGVHTIVFPVCSYAEVREMRWAEEDLGHPVLKVLAHPSKYPYNLIQTHLERYKIHGLELWNQQADSSYIPPLEFLEMLKTLAPGRSLRCFFGCDLHKANLTVANVISVPTPPQVTRDAIVEALIKGEWASINLPTGIEYQNGIETDLKQWLQNVLGRSYLCPKLRQSARRCLRLFYRMLPRNAQHSLNGVKNFVRNKV